MTAKRFILIKNTGTNECILDNLYDDGTYIGAISGSGSEMICYLLNSLHEENERLRKEKIDVEVKLYSANEKILMQMDYDEIIKQNTESEIEIINLKKENEQLKQEVETLQEELAHFIGDLE